MGVDIPSSYDVSVNVDPPFPPMAITSVGPVGPVTVAGIPDTFHINIDTLPKIQLGIDPLEIKPVDVSLRLKEFPSIRGHVPADFSVGLSVLGMELLSLRLCGEAQIITEPYEPNPCETCGSSLHTDDTHRAG